MGIALLTGVLAVTVLLLPQNASGERGAATLVSAGEATRVTVIVRGEPRGAAQPANIHAGTCDAVEAVRYVLHPLVNGRSVTVVPVSISALNRGAYAIVLQGSLTSLRAAKEYRYVSCGRV